MDSRIFHQPKATVQTKIIAIATSPPKLVYSYLAEFGCFLATFSK